MIKTPRFIAFQNKWRKELAVSLEALNLSEVDIKSNAHVCSRHFPGDDASKPPCLSLGKRFASPMKKDERGKIAKIREEERQLRDGQSSSKSSK